MEIEDFAKRFPRLYHLTFSANMPGIREHGLQSTHTLAHSLRLNDEERRATLETRRRCIQVLGGVTIRDQVPAHESKMRSCLVGITPSEWLALLNAKIFFFVEEEKALRLAMTYGAYANTLLEVDTLALLTRYVEHTALCRINAGAFLYNPRPRGRNSFIPLSSYIFKNKRDTPAELTVDCDIPDLREMNFLERTLPETNSR